MSNPLFNMLGKKQPVDNSQQNMIAQFQNFRKQMQGKNPQEEINRLLQSGQINQQQLNQAQQMAQQIKNLLR